MPGRPTHFALFSRKKRKEMTPLHSENSHSAGTWIVTDGSAGMEAQCIAVAEAVGLPFALKRVRARGPLRMVPVRLQVHLPANHLLRLVCSNEPLTPPWPRLIISSGRHSVPLALALKRVAVPPSYALHIQNPKVGAHLFDLVTAPLHDGMQGPNVISTVGSVHSVTPARLAVAAERFHGQIAPLPRPRIAVVLGGTSRAFAFPPDLAASFGKKLAALASETGGSLLVTPSRRTPSASLQALSDAIAGVPQLIWNGEGDNPYHAFLALAEAIVVTEDSVNMVTEAAGTGKPVYVQAIKGRSRRLGHFHAMMRQRGATRPFEGRIGSWSYTPINDTERVASVVRQSLGYERQG
jgi:mitochondrial fission protein ELM1